jgi:uncharacterized membrane protein
MPWHRLAATRLTVATLVGVATAVVILAADAPGPVALSAGWCAAAVVFLAWVWLTLGRTGPDEIADHVKAKAEDGSRATADVLLLGASVASLGVVGDTLIEAGKRSETTQGLMIGLAVLSVALGWATVHTVYTLRYADLYFEGSEGGIDFKGDKPDYLDFAYFGFTVGMTWQVSDTDVQKRAIRRAVLRHALLAYAFGTVIVAVTINLVASLLNG